MSQDSQQELAVTENKARNTGEWYAEVVKKAGLADYAPMGGFIVTRPRGYALWEQVQHHLDGWFKETGVQNAYFPMFIPESYLEQEKEIVEGFDPEVAWVTRGGYDQLDERLAVRPTSESIISPFMSQWIRSHRDLPLRLNQWCSVVRWEATETKPFFRTKEFLWQEGHTAHCTDEAAREELMLRLKQYQRLYEEAFAIPVLRGRKPPHDKFPGAKTTTTIEVLMPDGKSVQGATSHNLGTSFAEAYDITYADGSGESCLAHTTSWGLSWRALGALIMTHSDDQGLVLPPAMASTQVAIVPIWKGDGDTKEKVIEYASELSDELDTAGLNVTLDDRENRNPGFKFNEHELHGIPLRIEVGPAEMGESEVKIVQRPDGEDWTVDRSAVVGAVETALDRVHSKLYASAEETLWSNVREATDREEILQTIGEQGGYVTAPWCGRPKCEDPIKSEVHAEVVMIPFEDDDPVDPSDDQSCALCDQSASHTAYFAQSH